MQKPKSRSENRRGLSPFVERAPSPDGREQKGTVPLSASGSRIGSKKPFNPFYLLAMLFGIAFTITACAFGVMMLKSIRPEGLPEAGAPGHGLMDLLGRHGTAIMTAELAGLAVFTLPAIYLDHLRGRREVARQKTTAESEPKP
jgi:hypothetical protein